MKKRRFMYIYIQYSSQKQKWPNFEQYCFVEQSSAKKHHLKDGRYPINKGMFDSQSHPYMAAVWPAKSRLARSTGGDICPQRRVKAVLVTSGDVWSKNQQHWFLGMRIIVRKVGWFYVWGLLAMCVFNFLLLMGSCVLICSTCRNDWEVLQDFLSLAVFRAQHTSWLASCPSAGNQQAALGFPSIHDLPLQIESHLLKRWFDEMLFSNFHTPPSTPYSPQKLTVRSWN